VEIGFRFFYLVNKSTLPENIFKANEYNSLTMKLEINKYPAHSNVKIIMYLIWPLLLALLSCSASENETLTFKEIRTPNRSISPMISVWSNLQDTILSVKVDSLFRNHNRFPLVEIDSLYSDYLYVTFIYRDTSVNEEISFDIFGNYNDRSLGDKKLKRLKNTDLLYRTYYMPNDVCFSYRYIINDSAQNTSRVITDPLNEERIPTGEKKDYSWSVLDLRQNEEVWYIKKYNDIKSQLIEFNFTSSLLNNTRKIYVYLPENYDKDKYPGYPVIYLFDSFIYLNRIEAPNVLDNLIREEKIEPMIAVLIDNPSSDSRNEELPLNFAFKDFVINELLPHINKTWNVTDDPARTIIGGMSYGGLAAAFISFYADSIFGNVLSQSGSFWRDTYVEEPMATWPRSDWLINKFQTSDKKNIKLYLDWGLQEPLILNSNRKFVRILDKLGYDFKYVEFNGWHDWSNSRKTFPAGLLYLLGKE